MVARICTLILLLLSFSSLTSGQNADVHVKLSLADNKTVYRIGEPIKIALDFTADRDGYVVEHLSEGNEPYSDKIVISPDTGFTYWYAEYTDNFRYPRDFFAEQKLTVTPKRVEIVLNDSLRFDNPGRYTVSVTTKRIKATGPDAPSDPLTLTTNAISFEVQAMSDEDEAKEVGRLSASLSTKQERPAAEELARQLSYLTGEPSTREKVRRFIIDNQAGNGHLYNGLFIARNRALTLKLLESAMRDPNVPVTSLMLSAALRLKTLLMYGVSDQPSGPPTYIVQPHEDPRHRELRQGYIAELMGTLVKRSGNSLTTTASTIFAAIPEDSPSEKVRLREARDILVQQFDFLPASTQEWFLTMHGDQLRDPVLIPSLKKLLKSSGPAAFNLHQAALHQLLELAPDEARPYVIAEIRDPNSFLDVETLGKLKDDSLPEVDASLLEQLRKLTQSKQNRDLVLVRPKAQLLARFATENIYRELMRLYREVGANLSRDARAGLLAYFAKHNEAEAMPLIEQAVTDLKPGDYPQVLVDLTALHYSDAIGVFLKKLMETDNYPLASTAAYLIGVHGSASDEKLLEARLQRFQRDWQERAAEADAQQLGQIERELVLALVKGNSWKASPERVRELQSSCVTALCKQMIIARQ